METHGRPFVWVPVQKRIAQPLCAAHSIWGKVGGRGTPRQKARGIVALFQKAPDSFESGDVK